MFREFYYDYFNINLKDYGFGVDLDICKVLLAVTLGLALAVVFVNYSKACVFRMVKQLIRHDADSPDSAKGLSELGLSDDRGVKYALSRQGQLSTLVKRVGEVKLTYEEYIDREKEFKKRKKQFRIEKKQALAEYKNKCAEARAEGLTLPERPTFEKPKFSDDTVNYDEARYFIPEESYGRAKSVFENNGTSALKTALTVVFLFVVYVIVVMLMPDILNLIYKIF